MKVVYNYHHNRNQLMKHYFMAVQDNSGRRSMVINLGMEESAIGARVKARTIMGDMGLGLNHVIHLFYVGRDGVLMLEDTPLDFKAMEPGSFFEIY